MQLEATERDVPGDNEAEASRLPESGPCQSGATHPGTSVSGASQAVPSIKVVR